MHIQALKSTVADNDEAENIDIDAAMGDDHGSDDEESNQIKEITAAVTSEMDDDEAIQDAPCKSL
jgi:hypothetical protein